MTRILVITGQTATGKTSLAVELAHKYHGELISADSRQVYRGMDLVTGKDKDKIDVPIWLYDLIDPGQSFSVSQWQQKALEAIENIQSRGKLPIIVGGTGLYLRSLAENLADTNIPPDPVLRQKLSSQSVSDLFALLSQISPIKADSLNSSDSQNPRRLIRAIEIANYQNQQRPSLMAKTRTEGEKVRGGQGVSYEELEIKYIVLTCSSDILKSRIKKRVQSRIKSGALSELSALPSEYHSKFLASFDSDTWIRREYQYSRRQKVFFQKYFPKHQFDISAPSFHSQILGIISSWLSIST